MHFTIYNENNQNFFQKKCIFLKKIKSRPVRMNHVKNNLFEYMLIIAVSYYYTVVLFATIY